MTYAGFWKRTAAWVIDSVLYTLISYALGFTLGILLAVTVGTGTNTSGQDLLLGLLGSLLSIACYIIYYAWSESSAWQATIGKKLMGLKVTDIYGQRISFWRSLGRNVGMIVSSFILMIGYFMCIWTKKKQCLHDKMAGCLVVDNTPNEKQGCMWAVLIAWLLLVLAAIGLSALAAMPQVQEAVRAAQAQMIQRQTDMDQLQQRLGQEVQRAQDLSDWDDEE